MERLDQTYIFELGDRVRKGDSNAFAELFMALCERVYLYLMAMTGDEELSRRGVKAVFTEVLTELWTLKDIGLIMPWIMRCAFRFAEDNFSVKEQEENLLSRIMGLPLAESQILLMAGVQRLGFKETGDLLNVSGKTVRRFLKLANKHLSRNTEDSDMVLDAGNGGRHSYSWNHKMGGAESAKILRSIFDDNNVDPNTVPLESLKSYAVYRKERFSLQRGILLAVLIVFILMPVMFITPHFDVSYEKEGERGLPVYSIELRTLIPTQRVTATLLKHSLPVYEVGMREFTVEPIRNGKMTLEVELLNRQIKVTEVEVTDVDNKGPELVSNEILEDTFVINVRDSGIGVDYKGVYAKGKSGTVYTPVSASEEDGIIFAYPKEEWDIYIPDHIGNTLHLSLKFN